MNDRDPTNGELAIMIEGLQKNQLDAHAQSAESMGRIEAKVDHTNGRVRKLEQLKYVAIGAFAVTNVFIVPIVVQWLQNRFNP